MRAAEYRWRETLLALALFYLVELCAGRGNGQDAAMSLQPPAEVCESRTINYITHTLPQQCLRTSWTSPAAVVDPSATTDSAHQTAATTASPAAQTTQGVQGEDKPNGDATDADPKVDRRAEDGGVDSEEELATDSFMSFEEWKEMMLRKSGQELAEVKARKQKEGSGTDLDSLGDDGEIALEFDALADKVTELTGSQPDGATQASVELHEDQPVLYDDANTQYLLSKDAGKTCKERFSYASFDAGATVLKTSPGAKNSKAILVENKDSYMLLECRTKNKFVIVELSDDILVDTVVLANFEFFSSMIRKFRVSVSARYPVKIDKWVDLGTFEARNSRDIQPFLVEHPQIYTKYIRVEFLSHYGNEYYCPVSLLRVHGTRMIDSWKEPEAPDDADDSTESSIDGPTETNVAPVEPDTKASHESNITDQDSIRIPNQQEAGAPQWEFFFTPEPLLEICTIEPTTSSLTSFDTATSAPARPDSPISGQRSKTSSQAPVQTTPEVAQTQQSLAATIPSESISLPRSNSTAASTASSSSATAEPSNNSTATSATSKQTSTKSSIKQPSARVPSPDGNGQPAAPKSATVPTHTGPKNKTGTVSSATASPTVQESFFKAVTKRLQLLESNTSLSLQYIEDQSRFLQEALKKMEKKQVSRVDAFLDRLNRTVLAELRSVRTQYDQIWQSTVLALEAQRDQSQREMVALSSRLNVLADEVVFQKRMAILQSVLLLSCLILVIFSSRSGGFGELALHQSQLLSRNRLASASAPSLVGLASPAGGNGPSSPSQDEYSPTPSPVRPPRRTASTRRGEYGHHPLARASSYGADDDKTLPLTPTSDYEATPPAINVEEENVPFFADVAVSDFGTSPPRSQPDELVPVNGEYGNERKALVLDGVAEEDEEGLVEEDRPRAKKPLARRSGTADSQHGGAIKPLPALPEDLTVV